MKLVFLHGAGCSSLSFYYQLRHFRSAKAIDLPGHPDGKPCESVDATRVGAGIYSSPAYKNVTFADIPWRGDCNAVALN